jgi:cation diffusion facilitator CzcD-associated flavoprotein CzcO
MGIAIIGAGFGGIGAAIELRRHGFEDVVLYDRAPELGGTWHYNDYPGAACDVPSHLYSYSFAQRRHWSRICSPREEIIAYLREVAREHGVDALVRPATEIARAHWDRGWTLQATDGRTFSADALIVATGQLHRTHTPELPGEFAGHSFHSAEWDHGYDLRGKRVAVVGTGASAVQFIPEIAKQAQQLVVFQRTGNWFLPRKNHAYPPWLKTLIGTVPGLQSYRRQFLFWYGEFLTLMIRHPRTWGRIGRLRSTVFMRWQLRDPEVRRKAWPDYTFGCKRVLFSSYFLPALQRPNVELVTDRIETLTPRGIRAGGREYAVDCVIYGTGFKATGFMAPLEIQGRDGIVLKDAWADGAHAHLGIAVPGFPNLFLIYGPNTNTSGGSIILYEEAQARYIRQALELARRAPIEVREDVEAASDREVQARFKGTAWTRCDSWYRDDDGRIVTNWPGYMREYVERTKALDATDYRFLENGTPPSVPATRSFE